MTKRRAWMMGLVLMVVVAACGTGDGGNVSLSVAVPPPPAGLQQSPQTASLLLDDGTSTLQIDSAELVLRRIEFKRSSQTGPCPDDDGDGDDACDEFKTPPALVALPVAGAMAVPLETVITADLPEGTYTRVDFDVHKVSSGDADDEAFLRRHPDFEDVSIRVLGTFDGNSFVFTSDLDEEQKQALVPALVVAPGAVTNVTLRIDVSGWFVDTGGDLLDPTTANDGGPNENLVTDNIRASIEAFGDDDRDGEED